ncbi:MAG: RagB/SusD family nutrient uptake outer membrane protein [Paludibacteraceae bacterium]|nr:RagB/SusD family nutrient uptake outer membrane protein [Paludibacteraceae bacterium]
MKTIKYMMLAVPVLALVACSDFMSTNSPSAMDASYAYSSPERCEQTLAGVYDLFAQNNSYRNRMACGFQGLNTDIEHSTYSTSNKEEQVMLVLYNMTDVNSNVSNNKKQDIWSYLNIGIERCNNIIEGITEYGGQDAVTQYFLGEAYFLRAFQYLEMVKYWGDVPLRKESLAKNPDGINNPKTDRNEVYEFIREDLRKAAEILPWSESCPAPAANSIERPSKAAALALLARADLMYAGKAVRPEKIVPGGTSAYKVDYNLELPADRKAVYQEALDACAEIINHDGDSKLIGNYEQVFKDLCNDKTSYKTMEYIWVMPFAMGNRGQFLNYNCVKLTDTKQKDGISGKLPNFNASCSTNAVQQVSPIMIFDFEKGDKRAGVTYAPGVWYYNNAESVTTDETKREAIFPGVGASEDRLYEKHNTINKYYLGKYRVEWMDREFTTTEDGVNFPILRYADVLLMFAEASIGGISADKPENKWGLDGKAMLDKVRARAGLGAAATLDMDAIMHERACELCGEYVRKWDLMRWGNLKEKMIAARDKLDQMSTPEGRAALEINDSIYFKYAFDSEVNGWVIDRESIYGLHVGELGAPAEYDESAGWVKKEIYTSDSEAVLGSAKYPLFADEEKLESRQYWPIFSVNYLVSPTTLWNDYGY